MRALLLTLALGCIVVGILGTAFADGSSVADVKPAPPAKPLGEPYEPPPEGPRVQGDTIGDPFIVPSIPFQVPGTTCGFFDDYDEACPYTGSTSPDVVFRYDCPAPMDVAIDLCASTYDTKLYVYENNEYTLVACNDDACEWQSYLHRVEMSAGNTYYVVVDGYGGSCGEYYLSLDEWIISCTYVCPDNALLEGEPDCYDGYEDTYNGGCNVEPFPIFQVLEPSCDTIVVCGTSGVYMYEGLTYRDTDWFELDLPEAAEICLSGWALFPCHFFIIDGRGGCENLAVVAIGESFCEEVNDICYACEPGIWWVWVGPSVWDLYYVCGSEYWVGISGYTGGVSPAGETTWGRVKELFR